MTRDDKLAAIKKMAEEWLCWAGPPTQEARGCGNTDDERNEAANDTYRYVGNRVMAIIMARESR